MKRNLLYGLRGTILKYMSLTSIIPLVLSLLVLYVIARMALLSMAEQTMMNATHGISRMCENRGEEANRSLGDELERAWGAAKEAFGQYGNLTLGTPAETVEVTDQETMKKSRIKLPTLRSGDTVFLRNDDIPDGIVQRVDMRGATATVFQLAGGRLVRIATSVTTKEGARAVLTAIPGDSPVYRSVAAGRTYRGRASVMGTTSITHYEPLKSRDGKVIGALYIGVPAPKSVLLDMIRETRIADNGYVYIVTAAGRIIDHPFWTGTVLAEKTDRVSGMKLMDLINRNRGSFISYSIEGRDGGHSTKLAFVKYYAPLGWNIVATAEYDDILKSLNRIFLIMVVILVVSPVLILLVSSVLALRISRPFRSIIDTAVKVTEGDLGVFIPQKHYVKCAAIKNCTKEDCPAFSSRNLACWSIEGTVLDAQGRPLPEKEKIESVCSGCRVYRRAIRSEIDEIIEAVNKMIVTMQRIMRDIKRTAEEIHGDADMLTRTSGLLREESQTQAASIEETMSSDEELVATIEHVSSASNVQAEKMSQTSAAMEELTASTRSVGQHSINLSSEAGLMVDEARQTAEMLQRTTDKIGRIEESSRRIGDIIAMINDVSDQINLLSLNASIESARAGEHGKGFAVVAEEISKLADATAHSTKEIETLIKTSREEIGSGAGLVNQTAGAITVMIQKIEAAAKLIGEIATSSEEQIRSSEQVMADVEEVNRMSLQIAQANQEQKQSSTEILQAVTMINDSLQKVAASSQDVADSAAAMKERADRLHGIVGQFRVRD
ncbi:MAG: methyl-accepting chemotaxis protein [Spirochaetes bacterium]|nr:methyl-accepting chemotaxis protein [Spirochaetota bacterium]